MGATASSSTATGEPECMDGSEEHPMLCAGSTTLLCHDGMTSIDVELRCNGVDDCPDGSDELCGN